MDSSWENDGFPAVEPVVLPPDSTDLINPPEKTCKGCGEEIVREPGKKGRLPAYHPACKPDRGSTVSGTRPVRVVAKDRAVAEQVEQTLTLIDAKLSKAIMLLALVEPYDAFVLHVNKAELLENMRPVLTRFSWMREGADTVSTAAAIFSLGITVVTTVLPIAAHHKLIPSKAVAKLLVGIPFILKKMQDSMETNGEDVTQTLLSRIREQQARQNEAAMRAQAQSEAVDASFTG